MWFAEALTAAILFGIAGVFFKIVARDNGSLSHLLFGMYLTGAAGFAIWASIEGRWVFDASHLIAGVFIGFGSAFGNLLFLKAIKIGPTSLSSPLVNLNVVLVVLMAVFLYHESLTAREIVAICLLIGAIMFLPIDPHESLAIKNPTWYLLIIAAIFAVFFRNGGLKITEELNLDNTMVLFYGYMYALAGFGLVVPGENAVARTLRFKSLRLGLYTGVLSFVSMTLYAEALSNGPASLVSPIFSTSSLILATLCIVFFKERLSLFQVIALVLLFCGLILIKI